MSDIKCVRVGSSFCTALPDSFVINGHGMTVGTNIVEQS